MFDVSGGLVDATHPRTAHREMFAEMAPRLFRKAGIERIMFGSDEPASGLDLHECILQILKLDLTDDEKEQIFWRNAAGLLGLD
jgi:predicted TIM-barrel fold metal-dependent hydrolase